MQVHVADVGADVWAGQVRPTWRSGWRRPCNLAAVGARRRCRDGLLEHAVGRRIGDHQRKPGGRRAAALAWRSSSPRCRCRHSTTTTTSHVGHLGGGRVGAVGRLFGDQADVRGPAPPAVVAADRHQGRRIRPGRRKLGCMQMASKPVISRQPVSRPSIISEVAGGLVSRGEGVDVGEIRPGDGIISRWWR